MTFATDLARFAEKTQQSMDAVVRGTVLTMGSNIIMASPVDTGRFRANWQHATNSPPAGTVAGVDPSASLALSRLNAAVPAIQAGGIEYLTNNLPYAIPLEYGHSTQAPAGMVRVEVARFQAAVRAEVEKIK